MVMDFLDRDVSHLDIDVSQLDFLDPGWSHVKVNGFVTVEQFSHW